MTPFHSISKCPICGGGLCGVRICGLPSHELQKTMLSDSADNQKQIVAPEIGEATAPHGLVVCDECEAIWLEPDTSGPHQYTDAENPKCPICHEPLFGDQCHWANTDEVAFLGWAQLTDPELDYSPDDCDPEPST
ncbi:hypothetical protein [Crateriforma conspicua]|uniref:Uncharacterized protein n=1 Tax=Crateriforma conspicua TaxID=2527996 RepID=A0A5C5XVW9_9PLAN|nr:hypothetical protein [Crateriforma conspicua]QDV60919.1 hypothetical protein Mal65_00390 [Crateriforma conspicua]TWT65762.1 hypothetical protein Pan14r_53110 [Crateriforma conspicua]